MGLFDFFRKPPLDPPVDLSGLTLDLGTFTCDHTTLGHEPDPGDIFFGTLRTADVCKSADGAVEIGTKDHVLDWIVLKLPSFRGHLKRHGENLVLTPSTTLSEITSIFGEPYWTALDEDETILFYEYDGGLVELQFEFPDKRTLGVISLMRHGILSEPEQRQSYGVTKPWPPENPSQVSC